MTPAERIARTAERIARRAAADTANARRDHLTFAGAVLLAIAVPAGLLAALVLAATPC